jgi:hypothetical protein
MQPVHLLVVECDADWSQWSAISRSFGSTVVLLIQRADEAVSAFYQRIVRCLGERLVSQVTLMRAAGAAASGALASLLAELDVSTREV